MSQTEEALADTEARADLAEIELTAVRTELREFISWLEQPTRGPVVFRDEVAARLSRILDS